MSIISLSNELNPYNGIIYNGVPKYSFNRYGEGDFLDWHPDNHEILNGATITFVVQLNDNYDGGEIFLLNEGISLKPKQASVIIVPAQELKNYTTKNIVGTRYIASVIVYNSVMEAQSE